MAIITLASDYGTQDGYPAAVKGVLKTLSPQKLPARRPPPKGSRSIQPICHPGRYPRHSMVEIFLLRRRPCWQTASISLRLVGLSRTRSAFLSRGRQESLAKLSERLLTLTLLGI